MKKFLLTALILMAFAAPAIAGTITITTLSSDSGIVYTFFNTSFNTVKNCINGNIESVNIKDGTIAEVDMAAAANPRVRDDEFFNDFTYTGMLPADSANFTSDISAGTSYVSGYRVVTTATSKTYTASKDTWVYIDINGAFQYVETTVGSAQPATPANSLLLAKVTTDVVEITVVTDLRTTSISLGSQDDFSIKGLNQYWANGLKVSVDTGVAYNGTTRINKTSSTVLDVSSAANYLTGISERGASKWLYVYVTSTGSILLDDNAPDYHDTSGATQGIKYYYKYGTTYNRVVGQVRLDASQYIIQFYQNNKKYSYDSVVSYDEVRVLNAGASTSYAEVDCSAAVPSTSNMCSFWIQGGGGGGSFNYRRRGSSSINGIWSTLTDGANQNDYQFMSDLPLDSSRKGEYKVNANNVSAWVRDYTINYRD